MSYREMPEDAMLRCLNACVVGLDDENMGEIGNGPERELQTYLYMCGSYADVRRAVSASPLL